jgi:hypothetical protein
VINLVGVALAEMEGGAGDADGAVVHFYGWGWLLV